LGKNMSLSPGHLAACLGQTGALARVAEAHRRILDSKVPKTEGRLGSPRAAFAALLRWKRFA
jgi:hypothetical protein